MVVYERPYFLKATSPLLFGLLCGAPVYAQWLKAGAPDSVTALASGFAIVGDVLSDVIIAGAKDSVFVSTNGGAHWVVNREGLSSAHILSASVGSSRVFVGGENGRVFEWVSGGGEWQARSIGLTASAIYTLSGTPDYHYAGTNQGVFRILNNGGVEWDGLNSAMPYSVYALTILDSAILAGTDSGVAISINQGDSWSVSYVGLTARKIQALKSSRTSVFAGTCEGGVFRSLDQGENWMAVNSGLTNLDIRDLLIDSAGIFAATAGGVFATTDGGDNWYSVNVGLGSRAIHAMAVSGIGATKILIVATDSGVWRRPLSEMVTSIQANPSASAKSFRIDPSGSVAFRLAAPARVTLSAYTPAGRKITVLFSREFSAGDHAPRADDERLPAGISVYRLEVDGALAARRVVMPR